jgi:hypothetical protein
VHCNILLKLPLNLILSCYFTLASGKLEYRRGICGLACLWMGIGTSPAQKFVKGIQSLFFVSARFILILICPKRQTSCEIFVTRNLNEKSISYYFPNN